MNTQIAEIQEYLDSIRLDKSINTYVMYRGAIRKFFDFQKVNHMEDIRAIKSEHLRKFQAHLKTSGMKESSINSNIRPIKAMFNWLVENEYLSASPAKKIRELKTPKKIPVFLNEEEQDSMISVCENDLDRLTLALLLSTGLRRDELCRLTLNDYNGTHILVHGKGNKERSLALQDGVIALLDRYLEYRNKKYGNSTDALIVSRNGTHFSGDGIYKKVKSILKKAGIPGDRMDVISPHKLRHTFVANMLDGGADIFTCQTALGHSKITTTMLYAHLHNETLDKAIRNQKQII